MIFWNSQDILNIFYYRKKKVNSLKNRNYLSKNTEPATFPRIVIYGIRIFHWYITIAPTHLYFFSQAFYTIAEIAKAFSYALFRHCIMPTPTKKIQLFFPLHRLLHSHRTQPQTRTTAPNPSAYSNKVLSQPRAVCYSCILGAPFLVGGVT